MRHMWAVVAVFAAIALGGCAGEQEDFWQGLSPDLEVSADSEPLFDSMEDIEPDGPGGRNAFKPAEALVRGHVVAVEPGLALGGPDSPAGRVLPFDDSNATSQVVVLVVDVDRIVRGQLRDGDGSQVRIQWVLPDGSTLANVREALDTTKDALFFVSPAAERHRAAGQPVLDEAFEESTYVVVGGAAIVAERAGLGTPLWTDAERATRMATIEEETLDAVEKSL